MAFPGTPGYPSVVPDWNNVEVIHRNTLPPRSHFYVYDDESLALTRNVANARAKCLSGTWQFHLSKSPFDSWQGFHLPGFDTTPFSDIEVPGTWQLQGFGKGPHYTNSDFPWPVDPPNVPYDENECGRYRTMFTVERAFGRHRQLRLRFEGVDAAFTVWVNGQKVGYSQGSRNPSEFDVSNVVYVGEEYSNVLAVEVYQRCDGSYLEDQDQWWLSGIFRDVYLHSFPRVHPEDYQVVTELDDEYKDATLRVRVDVSGRSNVELKLLDSDGDAIVQDKKAIRKSDWFKLPVQNPSKWTAETPTLYTLVLNFSTGGSGANDGCSIVQRIGFRSTGLVDGVFCVNGQPIKIRGVNRHEHHPDHGRTVPYAFMKRDLLLMKTHNINAIRTCHQPSDPRLCDLADELGLWVLDEADLECHGFEATGTDPAKFTSDNPVWREQYVDRARQLVARDKNHACVILWSLGNEAFYGQNHQAMYDCIKEMDSTRLVHYEGDRSAQTADIFSRMYASVDEIESLAKERDWVKPLVLCEFLHAMGNSCGGGTEYVEAFYRHPRLMGGFVWEWANHGLRTKTKDGEEYKGYGGDFGDEPNDGNFIMDGMICSNHEPFSNLVEYAKVVEPVQTLALDGDTARIINRYDFVTLDHLDCEAEVVSEHGSSYKLEVSLPKGIKPHTQTNVQIKNLLETRRLLSPGEAFLRLIFTLRNETAWANAGHRVAFGELALSPPLSLTSLSLQPSLSALSLSPSSPQIQHDPDGSHVSITSANRASVWRINLSTGALASWRRAANPAAELLTEPLALDFYRALTDNDRSGHGADWVDKRVHQAVHHVRKIEWNPTTDAAGIQSSSSSSSSSSSNTGLEVRIHGRVAPPVLAWAVDVVFTYRFHANAFSLRIQGTPHGPLLPETFARVGVTLGLAGVQSVRWWGRGPGESYRDKRASQMVGAWEAADVDELWTDYEFPQDAGNRTDVRWVELRGKEGERVMRARFGDAEGASFSAMRYATKDIDECRHPYELHKRRREDTIVRLDWMHHGLGTASCGPWTLPQYHLKANEKFDVELYMD